MTFTLRVSTRSRWCCGVDRDPEYTISNPVTNCQYVQRLRTSILFALQLIYGEFCGVLDGLSESRDGCAFLPPCCKVYCHLIRNTKSQTLNDYVQVFQCIDSERSPVLGWTPDAKSLTPVSEGICIREKIVKAATYPVYHTFQLLLSLSRKLVDLAGNVANPKPSRA